MTPIQNIFLKGVAHGGDPVGVADEIFGTHDFNSVGVEVASTGGAESVLPYGESTTVKIPFFASGQQGGCSLAMLFQVDFSKDGADVTVYALS